MEEYKKMVEAILFTTGRLMDTEEIARLCNIGSIGVVKDIVDELKRDYESRESALNVVNEDNKFKLAIKKEYNYLTTNLMNDSELDEPTTKTLALIAYKQPVMQSEIIDMRGNTAYDHIKILRELIIKMLLFRIIWNEGITTNVRNFKNSLFLIKVC